MERECSEEFHALYSSANVVSIITKREKDKRDKMQA